MSKVAIRAVKLPSGEAIPALGRGTGGRAEARHGGARGPARRRGSRHRPGAHNLMHAKYPSPATGEGMRDRLFSHPTRRGRDLGWKALRSRRL
jgi:hypothetical protein